MRLPGKWSARPAWAASRSRGAEPLPWPPASSSRAGSALVTQCSLFCLATHQVQTYGFGALGTSHGFGLFNLSPQEPWSDQTHSSPMVVKRQLSGMKSTWGPRVLRPSRARDEKLLGRWERRRGCGWAPRCRSCATGWALVVVEAQSRPWPHLRTAGGLSGPRARAGRTGCAHQVGGAVHQLFTWWPKRAVVCTGRHWLHLLVWPSRTMLTPAWPTSPSLSSRCLACNPRWTTPVAERKIHQHHPLCLQEQQPGFASFPHRSLNASP